MKQTLVPGISSWRASSRCLKQHGRCGLTSEILTYRRLSVRSWLTFLLAVLAVAGTSAGLTAQERNAAPLGGPIVHLAQPSSPPTGVQGGRRLSSAVPVAGGTAVPVSGGTRVAQNGSLGGDITRQETDISVALGPLPVDINMVRRLKVAGQLVNEAPTRVGNLDIVAPLVPAAGQTGPLQILGITVTRAAAGNIPGNPNTPSEEQYFQINLPAGPPVVMAINRAEAYIDGVERPLRAAPVVIRGRIWLPVFSIAPLLGAATRLESDGTLHLNPTVQSVELFPVKGVMVLTIKTSAPLPSPLMGTLENPPKLYLDFPNYSMGFDAANSKNERTVSNGMGDITRVRAGLFQDFPDTTRVVLDLKRSLRAVSQPLPDKTLYALVLTSPHTMVSVPSGSLRGVKIVVDAGHGGHDNGAMGARSREKNHTLDISRRLARHLERMGATVVMTRNSDIFISLQGRVDFAHAQNADIFISVHINSFRSNSTGTETFYYSGQSLTLAREVHKEFVKATGLRSRGVSKARFYVIRRTHMPSILTETAFISNPNEEAKLVNPAWREQVAQGLARGLSNYASKYMTPGMPG